MFKRVVPFLSLFASVGTLFCCALPALFVSLGLGASLVAILGTFPQLIWLSTHKPLVFTTAGVLLVATGVMKVYSGQQNCPIEGDRGNACTEARTFSFWGFWLSVAIFVVGFFFAFIAPLLGQA